MQAEVWEGTRGAIQKALAQRYRQSKEAGAGHDAVATAALHPLGSDVVKVCLPDGQQKPFPLNCLSLMTVSGAKGSNVNFSQISALLGQQVHRAEFLMCAKLILAQPALPSQTEGVCLYSHANMQSLLHASRMTLSMDRMAWCVFSSAYLSVMIL